MTELLDVLDELSIKLEEAEGLAYTINLLIPKTNAFDCKNATKAIAKIEDDIKVLGDTLKTVNGSLAILQQFKKDCVKDGFPVSITAGGGDDNDPPPVQRD